MLAVLLAVLSGAHATTFVVDSEADTADADPLDGVCADALGRCTLGAALDQMASADTVRILVPAGTYVVTTPHRSPVGWTGTLVLEGEGSNQTHVVVDNQVDFGWLQIWSGRATVRHLAFRDGTPGSNVLYSRDAGPDLPRTRLVLEDVLFEANVVDSGAIVTAGYNTYFRCSGCAFVGNEMIPGFPAPLIRVAGRTDGRTRVVVEDSHFEANTSPIPTFAIHMAHNGLDPIEGPVVNATIRATTFVDHDDMGAVRARASVVSLHDTLVQSAVSGSARAPVFTEDSSLTVVRSAFIDNWRGHQPAAIYSTFDEGPATLRQVRLHDTLFRGNASVYGAGAVEIIAHQGGVEVDGVAFVDNDGGGASGALRIHADTSTPVRIANSWFLRNHADTGAAALDLLYAPDGLVHQNLFTGNTSASGPTVRLTQGPTPGPRPLLFSRNTLADNEEGLLVVGANTLLSGNVIEGNIGPFLGDDCVAPAAESTGDNAFGATTGCAALSSAGSWLSGGTTPAGDLAGTPTAPLPPMLAPLATYRGRPYLAPLPGGPLVDAALDLPTHPLLPASWSTSTDLLRRARSVDGDGDGDPRPDLGAVELPTP